MTGVGYQSGCGRPVPRVVGRVYIPGGYTGYIPRVVHRRDTWAIHHPEVPRRDTWAIHHPEVHPVWYTP